MNTRSFNIPAANQQMVNEQIIKLNKRAIKLGIELVTLSWGKAFAASDGTLVLPCDVGGPLNVSYDGWHFIATLQHLPTGENIIRALEGEDNIPSKYRSCGPDCEHCKVRRYRKDTYLVRHDDTRVIQVGSTCVKDFLGGNSPDNIMKHASFVGELFAFMEGAGHAPGGRDEGIFHIIHFLAHTAAIIRRYGWVPKKQAQVLGTVSTASRVLDSLSTAGQVTEDDRKLATKAVEWSENIPDTECDSSDYLYNIRAISRSGMVGTRTVGFAASIISAHQRWQKDHPVSRSNYVGGVGDVITVPLTLKRTFQFEGSYGTTNKMIFEDERGNVLVWSTSTDLELEKDKTYSIRGTIKDHSEYRDVKQTVLTRCKVLS